MHRVRMVDSCTLPSGWAHIMRQHVPACACTSSMHSSCSQRVHMSRQHTCTPTCAWCTLCADSARSAPCAHLHTVRRSSPQHAHAVHCAAHARANLAQLALGTPRAALHVCCLQVSERYPWSGEERQNGRRDMRRGMCQAQPVHVDLNQQTSMPR